MGMSWIETTLTRMEAHLRSWIEGDPGRRAIPRSLHSQLERELISAMMSNLHNRANPDDPLDVFHIAPDQYTLVLLPAQAQLLLTHPNELDRLTRKLENAAYQAGIVFNAAPILCVVADPTVTDLRIMVESGHSKLDDSYTVEVDGAHRVLPGGMPKAFLIVNGLSTFPITEPVINIGRDPSNQLCLDDRRVSRLHAQLRLFQGKFVIFDLDSKGGTFVNGVAASRHALTPGDVILLAGVPIVYGEDSASTTGYTQELPVEPPAPEVL